MSERPVTRKGDDRYLPRADGAPGKLSVSIATASATATLILTDFNVAAEGTPVPSVGLAEPGVEPYGFGTELLQRYADEVANTWRAGYTTKSQ